MPEYRIYRRSSSAGFDGTTPEEASYTKARYLYSTEADGAVGQFPAAKLGRSNVASLVRCTLDGVSFGDYYAVLTASGVTRSTATFATADTEWLLMHPGDTLALNSAAARTADIFVNDLDDEQFAAWARSRQHSSSGRGYSEQTILAAGAITAWSGRKTVFAALAAAGTVSLPPLTAVEIGDVVHVIRTGGEVVQVEPSDTVNDQMNGVVGTLSNYFLRNVGESVTLVRVSGGWQRDEGVAAAGALALNAGVTLGGIAEGYRNVIQGAAASASVVLPALAAQREGAGFLFEATGLADTQELTPDGAETINGAAGARKYFAGQPVLLISKGSASDWAMIGGYDQGQPTAVSTGVSVALTPFSGIKVCRFTGGAAQTITTPSAADCGSDSRIIIANTSANAVNVGPAGAGTIDSNAGAIVVPGGQRAVLYRDTTASSDNWISIISA